MSQDAYDSYKMLLEIRQRMGEFFKDGIGQFEHFGQTDSIARSWKPPFDLLETEDEVLIFGELPGLQKSELEVYLKGNDLVVNGERRPTPPDGTIKYHMAESYYGAFSRTFKLPDHIDDNKITTTLNNGLLGIRVSKKRGRKIPIK